MTKLTFDTRMPCSQQKLWEFHSSSDALHSLSPPLTKVKLEGELRVVEGAKLAVTSTILGVIKQEWEVELSGVSAPNGFTDCALKSPFVEWKHNHIFLPYGLFSVLRDEIYFVAPGGAVGNLASTIIVTVLFKFRHLRTKKLIS